MQINLGFDKVKKILHIAAITLPPEPCSAILTSVVFNDYTFYNHTLCQLIMTYKSKC